MLLKSSKTWGDIVNKLPEDRKNSIMEKGKQNDPTISLKKICKNKFILSASITYYPRISKIWVAYLPKVLYFKIYPKSLEVVLVLIITIWI